MNAVEQDSIGKLREELRVYHADIVSFAVEVAKLSTEIYGKPDNRSNAPGLISEVADLHRSRTVMLLGIRGAWAIITVLVGAVAAYVLKK